MSLAFLPTLKIVTALASVLFGIFALWQPGRTAQAASINADTAGARAEIRASWGGLFLGLGLAVLLIGSDDAYRVFGVAYAITAAVRSLTWVLDRSLITRNGMVILTFEVISAIVFMLPEGSA